MSELSKEQCEEIRARAERAYLTDADMRAFDTHAKKDIFALLAEIARLNALLAEAREGLRMIADRRGNFGSGVKLKALAHQYLAKLGA